MKAIAINPGTLDKINDELSDDDSVIFERWYSTLTTDPNGQHQTLYFVAGPVSDPIVSKVMAENQFFYNFVLVTTVGDWSRYPNEWFEIRNQERD